MLSKFREKVKLYENDIIIAVVIILVALIGFGLGRLSVIREQKIPAVIENTPAAASSANTEKLYVASKNSDKYHYPWCSGAQRIKEENKVWFSSKEEAEKAGYSPATNCKGLQ
jgi:hypothetical protein